MTDALPPNLSDLDRPELRVASDERDRRLAPLFRRWPSLSRGEMAELRRLYAERLRLAKYVGSRRGRAARVKS